MGWPESQKKHTRRDQEGVRKKRWVGELGATKIPKKKKQDSALHRGPRLKTNKTRPSSWEKGRDGWFSCQIRSSSANRNLAPWSAMARNAKDPGTPKLKIRNFANLNGRLGRVRQAELSAKNPNLKNGQRFTHHPKGGGKIRTHSMVSYELQKRPLRTSSIINSGGKS